MEIEDSKIKNLTHVLFRDQAFINYNPLNELNCMDYFYLSPFFEKNSINYICTLQKLDFNIQKVNMNGVEFNLEYFNREKDLFYITKNYRQRNKITLLSYYYIFKGTIYQSPDLYSLLMSNVESLTDNFVSLVNKFNESN